MQTPIGRVNITPDQLIEKGLAASEAVDVARRVNDALDLSHPAETWRTISQTILTPSHPFAAHESLYDTVFADWDERMGPRPAWTPTEELIRTTNEAALMRELKLRTYGELHRWSVENREAFWNLAVERLGIRFHRKPARAADLSGGAESPAWLPGGRLNIVESCFTASPDSPAILYQREGGAIQTLTLAELDRLSNRVANGLVARGFQRGDAFAVDMPMTAESVAIYLGAIKLGGVIVSIADSFMPKEIATRVRLGAAKAIFTQDVIQRAGKTLPMYEKVLAAESPPATR
jgi:acetyl-CoA synthetase